MPANAEYSFIHYLEAKRTLDDRALNRPVWEALVEGLSGMESPLSVLEVGAGIGTMIERALEWKLYAGDLIYHAIDADADAIAAAGRRLGEWVRTRSLPVKREFPLSFGHQNRQVQVILECARLSDFISRHAGQRRWDALIAHAFLDLLNIPATLPGLLSLLRDGGWFYLTLTFDGVTALEPALDPAFDAEIEALYHRTMDERLADGQPSGDSRSGRHLLAHLRQIGADVVAAGSSDWVVFPRQGRYPADEAYFLRFIVHTIHSALKDRPDIDTRRFEDWIAARHAQIERGELIYIAHQLDVAGRWTRHSP